MDFTKPGSKVGTIFQGAKGMPENSSDEVEIIPICYVKWETSDSSPLIYVRYQTPGNIALYNRMGVVEVDN